MYRPPKIPSASAPSINIWAINSFKGVDLTSAPANMNSSRSPEAPNMMPDLEGKPMKRPGHHTFRTFTGKINGEYKLVLAAGEKALIHEGTNIWLLGATAAEDTKIYSTANNDYSVAWQLEGKLWILDGLKFLYYDGTTIASVESIAYIPTLSISRKPTGGGKSHEEINLLQNRKKDSFWIEAAESTVTVFQLSLKDLDASLVAAKKLNADGTYTTINEGAGLSVNRPLGQVTFVTAPGATPITGQDNLEIEFGTASNAAKINKCTIATLFGENGANNRMFITGNSDFPNYDWNCDLNNPAYFADTWYSILGQDKSPVTGYSVLGDMLAAHKADNELSNVIMRKSTTDSNGKVEFNVVTTLIGEGAIGKHTFGYLTNEPLFFSPLGVYAITRQDTTTDRYTQGRSYYVDKVLTAIPREDMEKAYACIWKNFYVLAIQDRIYLLDGKQRTYEKNAPLSSFQYECYYWPEITARIVWEYDGTLYYGTEDGKIEVFYTETYADSFNDNGAAIKAYWDTPEFSGKNFYKNKNIQSLYAKIAPTQYAGVQIFGYLEGYWGEIFNINTEIRYFDLDYFDLDNFTLSTDRTPRTVGEKTTIGPIDKIKFRFLNEELNAPFGLYEIGVEYTESGYY